MRGYEQISRDRQMDRQIIDRDKYKPGSPKQKKEFCEAKLITKPFGKSPDLWQPNGKGKARREI